MKIKRIEVEAGGGLLLMASITLVFAAMKVSGAVAWSWWWVLAPLWMPAALLIGIGVFAAALIVAIEVWTR